MNRPISPRFSLAVCCFLFALLVPVVGVADDATTTDDARLRFLLLDYHAPIEHDVLLSHLCVQPCRRSTGCPDELVAAGVDFYNEDFAVFRPGYLGSSSRFVVDAYKHRRIDLLSMSGHHASGFSGEMGRGRFHTRDLARDLRGVAGRDGFFDHPAMVMLQGCWTDVKSGFDGDPIEYVRHIIEDTAVRAGESNRLLAAIQQIAGDGSAYRQLFPNACILGYQGTQIPGGLLEIYGQVHNTLRGLEAMSRSGEARAPKFGITEARRSDAAMASMVREVDAECRPSGWPCNLCRQDPATYEPLRDALADFLRGERARLHQRGEARGPVAVNRLETALEDASLYANVRWACSEVDPSTAPVYPEPIDRGPHMELLLDLLMLDFGQIEGDVRFRIESELAHLLGGTAIDREMRARLRARLTGPGGTAWRRHFVDDVLARLSTFRQRDAFHFFAEIGCVPCLEDELVAEGADAVPRVRRENAASQLRPRLGRSLYETALDDPSARVRLLAASTLHPGLGADLVARAQADPDERVRRAMAERLAALDESGESLEAVDTAIDAELVAQLDPVYPPAGSALPDASETDPALARLDFESGALPSSADQPTASATARPAGVTADPEPPAEIARLDFEAGGLPSDADGETATTAADQRRSVRSVDLAGAEAFGEVTCRYAARLYPDDRVRDCVLAGDQTFDGVTLLAGSHAFFRPDGQLEGATLFRPHTFSGVEIGRGWAAFEAGRIVARGDGEYPAED